MDQQLTDAQRLSQAINRVLPLILFCLVGGWVFMKDTKVTGWQRWLVAFFGLYAMSNMWR